MAKPSGNSRLIRRRGTTAQRISIAFEKSVVEFVDENGAVLECGSATGKSRPNSLAAVRVSRAAARARRVDKLKIFYHFRVEGYNDGYEHQK